MQSLKRILVVAFVIISITIITNGVFGATTQSTGNDEIDSLNKVITERKAQLDEIKKQQDAYREQIKKKQSERSSLENQLEIISDRTAETKLGLEQVKIDIETTNLETQKVALEIVEHDKKITDNKGHLSSALKLLNQEDNKSQLEILLLNNYLTDYINQITYLENINDKIADNLTDLRFTKEKLKESQEKLIANSEKLNQLKSELENRQVALANEEDTKNFLLDQTKNSEAEYQSLLEKARREQTAASADVLNLEKSLREKINQLGKDGVKLVYNGFIWPIPSKTITAYFHDPDYPFRRIFEHPAVDIRTPQGTPIRATASGYIGRAKDGGMGYSYIMILHADNLSTVYGHVSKIYVKEDEYVTQGQIIGLSGAMPGTPGAGPLTTGPHLHFEVRLNGIPVDPLSYLQ